MVFGIIFTWRVIPFYLTGIRSLKKLIFYKGFLHYFLLDRSLRFTWQVSELSENQRFVKVSGSIFYMTGHSVLLDRKCQKPKVL